MAVFGQMLSFLRVCRASRWCDQRGFRTQNVAQIRFRNRRTTLSSQRILLDKFIKFSGAESCLVAKAPFSIRIKGSYFDTDFQVDRHRNRRAASLIEGRPDNLCEIKETSHSKTADDPQPQCDEQLQRDVLNLESAILDQLVHNLSQDILKQARSGGKSGAHEATWQSTTEKANPLHMLIYGRSQHRVDSYSVLSSGLLQHQTHIYLTEAAHFEEVEAFFGHLEPSASASIWDHSVHTEDDRLRSGIKIYCPPNVLNSPDNGISLAYLVPTNMNRIFLQADRNAHLEFDASLLDELLSVGLYTEVGNLRVREVHAQEIKLASRLGDILCEGALHGHIMAETFSEGDVVARNVSGSSFTVNTEHGDVHVWDQCRAEVSQFYTKSGCINVRELFNQAYMVVSESGHITTNLSSGSLTAMVKHGSMLIGVDQVLYDSTLQVENGHITIIVPQKRHFLIDASASSINICPSLLNAGELFLSESTGLENFVTNSVSRHDTLPTLKLMVANGTINLSVRELQHAAGSADTKELDSI